MHLAAASSCSLHGYSAIYCYSYCGESVKTRVEFDRYSRARWQPWDSHVDHQSGKTLLDHPVSRRVENFGPVLCRRRDCESPFVLLSWEMGLNCRNQAISFFWGLLEGDQGPWRTRIGRSLSDRSVEIKVSFSMGPCCVDQQSVCLRLVIQW